MILPKSLEHIRKWTDRHKIHYSIESSVIGDPVEYTMTFRKRGAYIVKISGSELDHTVDFNNTMAKEVPARVDVPEKSHYGAKKSNEERSVTDKERKLVSDFLYQPNDIENIIACKLATIERLEASQGLKSPSLNADHVQTSHSLDQMGDTLAKVADLQNEVNRLQNLLSRKVIEVSNAISRLEDTREQKVLTMYYIQRDKHGKRLKLSDIEAELHYSRRSVLYFKSQAIEHLFEILQSLHSFAP